MNKKPHQTERVCTRCLTLKPASAFYRRKCGKGAGRLLSWCYACSKAYQREVTNKQPHRVAQNSLWHKGHPERSRFHKYKSLYGVTEGEYLRLRNSACEICSATEKVGIDHCHKTGKVRGALCKTCNAGLGMLRDDLGLFRMAITYLEHSL